MPDLRFQVTGVAAAARGVVPLLEFRLQLANAPAAEPIQAVLLHVQIQIQSLLRTYTAREQERLGELFGAPECWGQTLRNQLWTHAHVSVGPFHGSTTVPLTVPCTYDLNVTATKYFYALESGEVSLLFLFSGTVFYASADGRLQVQQIPWERECSYRVPVASWRALMEQHYPNSAWLYLQRDVFERLYDFKRRHGLATWDQTIDRLLPALATQGERV